jgi:hypothetical protein
MYFNNLRASGYSQLYTVATQGFENFFSVRQSVQHTGFNSFVQRMLQFAWVNALSGSPIPVPLRKKIRKRSDVKLLTTSNTTPTSTTAAADELNNVRVVRISTEISGFDCQRCRYTLTSLRNRVYKPLC